MRRFSLVISLVLLTACAGSQEIIQSTNTPPPSTATPAPTETPLPSPSPTPDPYLLGEGVLQDWDESAGDYVVVAEGIDSITTTADGEILAVDSAGFPRFVFNGDVWEELKVDPNYGYIAPEVWGEESLPLIKEWWEGYKEKMPTNEDIKWLTYEDGSKVEMGELPQGRYANSRTFGFILADMFDFPDSIDPSGYEQMLLTLSPTNSEKIEEAGNIVPIRLTTDPKYSWNVSLRIIGANGAVKGSLGEWDRAEAAYQLAHKDLIRFLRVGLSGENPPLYGCQLVVALAGSDSDAGSESKYINSIYGEEGDGEWEVDNNLKWLALQPQGAGLFAIHESCMTDEMWEVFRALPNNPIGG